MKMTTMKLACALVVALAGGATAAEMPAERHAGSVSYVTGGVSDEEATLFKQARASYPLSIELLRDHAGKQGYTADAQVRVVDASGSVLLDAKADGPFMLVRLPAGTYRVQATLDGQTVHAKPVTTRAGGHAQALIVFADVPR